MKNQKHSSDFLPGWTDASVGVDAVDASAAVHTAALCAVFVVGLTSYAGETQGTRAGVRVHVLIARGAVGAWIRQAFVDIDLAVFPFKTVDTETGVIANVVQTCASILTRNYRKKNSVMYLRQDPTKMLIADIKLVNNRKVL